MLEPKPTDPWSTIVWPVMGVGGGGGEKSCTYINYISVQNFIHLTESVKQNT